MSPAGSSVSRSPVDDRFEYRGVARHIEGKPICGVDIYPGRDTDFDKLASKLGADTVHYFPNNGGVSFMSPRLSHVGFASHAVPEGTALFAGEIAMAKHYLKENERAAENAPEQEPELKKAKSGGATSEQLDAECRVLLGDYAKLFSQTGIDMKISVAQPHTAGKGYDRQEFRFFMPAIPKQSLLTSLQNSLTHLWS
jgi:hypothetical protein